MTIQRTVQGVVLTALVIAALFVVGRGLVYLTGDNSIVSGLGEDAPRGGCPQTDNCVSSHATQAPWAIEPLACDAGATTALAAAHDAIMASGDVEEVQPQESYIAYSRLMRFPDDVRIAPSGRGVEILSSSRLGAGDLGVNRRRVESVREAMAADDRC